MVRSDSSPVAFFIQGNGPGNEVARKERDYVGAQGEMGREKASEDDWGRVCGPELQKVREKRKFVENNRRDFES